MTAGEAGEIVFAYAVIALSDGVQIALTRFDAAVAARPFPSVNRYSQVLVGVTFRTPGEAVSRYGAVNEEPPWSATA